jgi:hypothetical protein
LGTAGGRWRRSAARVRDPSYEGADTYRLQGRLFDAFPFCHPSPAEERMPSFVDEEGVFIK